MAQAQRDDHADLAIALDHAWRWYELRHTQGIQAINFFMLAVAVLSAGYVTALTSKLYVAAGAVGVVGAVVSMVIYSVARRLRSIGMLAEDPLSIIQDRLASSLKIDSLRMMTAHRSNPRLMHVRAVRLYGVATGVAVTLNLAATAYAWFGH